MDMRAWSCNDDGAEGIRVRVDGAGCCLSAAGCQRAARGVCQRGCSGRDGCAGCARRARRRGPRGVRAVRGSVACDARRGRPHRSVEQEPAMPGPRLSRAAWQHGPPDRHHHTQPRSDDGTNLWMLVASAPNRGSLRLLGRGRFGSFLWPVIVFSSLFRQWGSASAEVLDSIRSSAADGTRRERAPRGPLDGAAGRSCGERFPPAPRRRRLLFHAVRVHKIIIGRRRWWAGPRGAEPSLTSVEPGLAVPASPTFHHRCLRVACVRHTALTRQAYTNPPPLAPTPWLLCQIC